MVSAFLKKQQSSAPKGSSYSQIHTANKASKTKSNTSSSGVSKVAASFLTPFTPGRIDIGDVAATVTAGIAGKAAVSALAPYAGQAYTAVDKYLGGVLPGGVAAADYALGGRYVGAKRTKRISYTNVKALKRSVRRLAGFNQLAKKTSQELRKLSGVHAPRQRQTLNAYEIQLARQLAR